MDQPIETSVKNNEDVLFQLDVEHMLQHLMEIICQPLKIYDLSHVAQVCRSWNEEAHREMDKRYLEYKVLPHLQSKEIMDPFFHVSKILRCKPSVTILFPGSSRDVEDIRNQFELELDTAAGYHKQIPNKLIVVGVFESTLDRNLVHSMPMKHKNEKSLETCTLAGILGLFLPCNKKLNVRVSYVLENDFFVPGFNREKIHDMLGCLESNSSKSTLIIFVANPDRVFDHKDPLLTSMLDIIKSKYTQTTVWGLVTSYKIFVCDNDNKSIERFDEFKNEAKIVALNLTGLNLESWSTIINVKTTKSDMKKNLQDFKNKINIKKCNLGLISAPIVINDEPDDNLCYEDNHELAREIKKIFPEITFLGAFCEDEDFYFGINSCDDSREPVINNNIISIMIISYD